jgi:uncharacterized protein YbgA (DUF1722 family)
MNDLRRGEGNLAAEIQDLESYLASVPDDLKSRGVFAAYEERLQVLQEELLAARQNQLVRTAIK